MRQPQSGRICRSPSAVPMMMRTDSSMFCSYLESWIPPPGPTEKGNLKPTPRKLLMPVSPQVLPCRYAVAIPTSTTRLQFGQLTVVRPPRSSTRSPSEKRHSGQTSPCIRPAVTASTTSYQSDSSSLRRSSGLSGISTYPHYLSLWLTLDGHALGRSASLVPLPPLDQVAPPAPEQPDHMPTAFHGRAGGAGAREVLGF